MNNKTIGTLLIHGGSAKERKKAKIETHD